MHLWLCFNSPRLYRYGWKFGGFKIQFWQWPFVMHREPDAQWKYQRPNGQVLLTRCQGDTWWYHGNHISSVLQLIKYCLATALEKQWNGKTKDALVWIMTGLKKDWKSNCQTNYIEISKLKIPNIFNSHSCIRNINDRGTDWDRTP